MGPKVILAEFNSDQVAILANANSNDSVSVAKHYAQQRGVPLSHILAIDVSAGESMTRQDYEKDVVRMTRALLEQKGLAQKIRILITTYGIPLRVSAPRPTPQETQWAEDARGWRRSAVALLHELEHDLMNVSTNGLGHEHTTNPSLLRGEAPERTSQAIEKLFQSIESNIKKAGARLQQLDDSEKKKAGKQALQQMVQRFGGLAAGTKYGLRRLEDHGSSEGSTHAPTSRTDLSTAQQALGFLNQVPTNANREKAYQLAQRYFGLVGVIQFATQEIESFQYRDADASLDSELSLLWWDRGMYSLSERISNPLYAWDSVRQISQASPLPILLVSRIDAPTPFLAMQMVNQARMAERTGLTGKVYIDARGKKPGKSLSYGYYDQSLRDLAKSTREITSYEVVLENTEQRFSQPGEAPDVGVYVGWYKLRSYEDAFTFNPGAIGYHIASGEAVSIHNPFERGWCKNALERGITVTLGSVGEPYLDAFPLPTEFFGLLFSGRYSLVEAYYLSLRHLSWRMVLFGDPLYNPWRDRPLLKKVQASGILKKDRLPTALSEVEFPDPVKARKHLIEKRRRLLSHLP